MGTTLLIGSCEPFSGKSALVLGIAQQLSKSGQAIRFGKPLATSLDWDPNKGPCHSPSSTMTFVSSGTSSGSSRIS